MRFVLLLGSLVICGSATAQNSHTVGPVLPPNHPSLQVQPQPTWQMQQQPQRPQQPTMTLCPDGSYVYGQCVLAPNGRYIGR